MHDYTHGTPKLRDMNLCKYDVVFIMYVHTYVANCVVSLYICFLREKTLQNSMMMTIKF